MKSAPKKDEDEDDDRFYPDVARFEAALAGCCDDDHKAYALIDGRYCDGIYGRLLNFEPRWATLLQGKAAQTGIQESVFVVQLEFGHRLVRWLIEENWGNGCIVWLIASTKALTERYARTHIHPGDEDSTHRPTRDPFIELPPVPASENEPVQMLRRHFRRFTKAEMEDSGRLLNFRFQDPATLRTYLQSCNEEELARFLGPVKMLWVENYSRVPSLNKPHQLYEFWHQVETRKDANGYVYQNASRLKAALYDLDREQGVAFDRPPMQTERPGRQTISSLIILRNGQIKAFEEAELEVTKAEIISSVADLGIWPWKDQEQLYGLIRVNIDIALSLNLSIWSEIWSFAVCALSYGNDFYKSMTSLNRAIEERAQTARIDDGLEPLLGLMADIVIEGQKGQPHA